MTTNTTQASDIDDLVVDVRNIAPKDRHPIIFDTFDGLAAGRSMILVNDHDPKPLYYQFLHERAGQFDWTYLQEGPDEWRVRIATTKS